MSIAQNLYVDQFFSESDLHEIHQPNFRSTINDSSSISWPHIIALESIILGYSYLSTYTWGAYFTGGSFGIGAVGLTGMVIFSENSNPEITLPFAVGYGFLTYYNFRFAESHTPTRKFLTNVVGFHATMLSPVLIGLVVKSSISGSKNLSIQPGIFYNIHSNFSACD